MLLTFLVYYIVFSDLFDFVLTVKCLLFFFI